MLVKDDLVGLFISLVKIDSPSGFENKVREFACKYIANHNIPFNVYVDSIGNLICKTKSCNNPILFTAHLDTVEPGRGIQPIVLDSVIKSDGSTILGADNKAGIACILYTLKMFFDIHKCLPELEVVFTVSEEAGNIGAVNLDYSLLKSRLGFSFDGSDTVGGITIASPFYSRFDIEIIGKSSHAGKPERSINALSVFLHAMQNIKLGWLNKDTLLNIGMVNGGLVRNTVIGSLSVKGEVRSYNQNKLNDVLTNTKVVFQDACNKFGARLKFEQEMENTGFDFGTSDSQVCLLQNILQQVDIRSNLLRSLGCYDANVFIENGVKVVNISNGSRFNHTTDESINIQDLLKTSQICSLILEAQKENLFNGKE